MLIRWEGWRAPFAIARSLKLPRLFSRGDGDFRSMRGAKLPPKPGYYTGRPIAALDRRAHGNVGLFGSRVGIAD
jgi:hypothetical protein